MGLNRLVSANRLLKRTVSQPDFEILIRENNVDVVSYANFSSFCRFSCWISDGIAPEGIVHMLRKAHLSMELKILSPLLQARAASGSPRLQVWFVASGLVLFVDFTGCSFVSYTLSSVGL